MASLASKDIGPLSSVISRCSCSPCHSCLLLSLHLIPPFPTISLAQPQAFCGARSAKGLSCSR